MPPAPEDDKEINWDSIAMELANRECARLGVAAVLEEEPDEGPPPFAGFYNSLKELHDKQTEPADYVLVGVRRRQVTLFLSVTNLGKTTILINHCLGAAGRQVWRPLLPVVPERPLKILYFDGESTDDELKQDTLTMLRAIGGADEALANFIPIVEAEIKGEALDLSVKDHFKFVKAIIQKHAPDLCVFDTIGALFTVFNENDNAEIKRKVIKPLKELAKAGNCAIIGVHHVGKRGENTADEEEAYLGRGASAFGSDTRAVFVLKRERSMGEGFVRLSLAKAKGVQFDPVILQLDLKARTFTILGPATPERKLSLEERVLQLLNGKPVPRSEIIRALSSASRETVDRTLKKLLENGRINKIKIGNIALFEQLSSSSVPIGTDNDDNYRKTDDMKQNSTDETATTDVH